MSTDKLLAFLRKQKVETWFDLGLFLDRFKEEQTYPSIVVKGSYEDFKEKLRTGGVGFITFHYMVDGVTMEVSKYASLFRRNLPGVPVHLIAGRIHLMKNSVFNDDYRKHVIPEIEGFDDWSLYREMYFTRLERGSNEYNE